MVIAQIMILFIYLYISLNPFSLFRFLQDLFY